MDQKIKDGKQAELKPEDMPDMTKFAEAQKQMQVAVGPLSHRPPGLHHDLPVTPTADFRLRFSAHAHTIHVLSCPVGRVGSSGGQRMPRHVMAHSAPVAHHVMAHSAPVVHGCEWPGGDPCVRRRGVALLASGATIQDRPVWRHIVALIEHHWVS
jgi:hypothetical protein